MNPDIIPRPEYPRPQMVREKWMNLNGVWDFEIDQSNTGLERKLHLQKNWSSSIVVPFCPESSLSCVEHKDFMKAVWYRREFTIPESWNKNRILLHFGAVDYEANIWINGSPAGNHKGGYSSFCLDITPFIVSGKNIIVVYVQDNTNSGFQAKGKQSRKYHSFECEYTRTTGIWQTVWLEAVSEHYIKGFRYYPDIENGLLRIDIKFNTACNGMFFYAESSFEEMQTGGQQCIISGDFATLTINLSEVKLWSPENPQLYSLKLMLKDKSNTVVDMAGSYFGMRCITIQENKILLNGKAMFQRLVLDQGFYPDGIYTAPTDADLKKDIEIAQAMGFNGARLHQKVFEPRFLYWADKLGYLVWGEYGDTGLNLSDSSILANVIPEWLEIIERDFNSPALIVWCPFNETRDWKTGAKQLPEIMNTLYRINKAIDPTRPSIDASGFIHGDTDIFDVHEYEQKAEIFTEMFKETENTLEMYNTHPKQQSYKGQPYMVGEYGGTWWNPGETIDNQMSYGEKPSSSEEFLQRYEALTVVLLKNPNISGFCYTQLYDIEQEVNGLYTYSRMPKFDAQIIKKINTQKAAIEK